jgi:two-component system cell cycle sensor histidine kinase/response regulator CckA
MPATIRTLIVEDNPQDAELAERQVRSAGTRCTFLRVDSKDAMIKALREFVPDVILTDHSIPQFSARDALQVAQQLSPGTPVIVVTGRLGDESAVEYLQAGAADYIVKDHLERLGPAVLRALETKRSREEQTRAHQLQAATYRIAQVAMSTPGLQDLWPVIHQIVGELMPAKNFYIALYDPATELLSFPYFVDEVDTDVPSKRLGKGLTEYVLRTGRPLLVTPEVYAELERRGEVELIGAPSIDWVGVPLKIGDRTLGVLVVQTYAPGVRYGEREKEILQFVSTQVAMAIERGHAETELRTSEARLKAIIDAALDAVITMDGDGVIRSWSPQAERVFGWPAAEAVGQTLSTTIVPPRHRDAHEGGLARFLATGEGPVLNQRIEITGLRRDGREIPVELTITPLRVGGAWLFSAFVRDISDRKLAEQRRAAQYAVTRILAEATTLVEAGSAILRTIAESFDWQAGVLWIIDPDGAALRCLEMWHSSDMELGEFARATRAMTFARGVGFPGQVWASDGPIWHRDVSALAGSQFPRLPHATGAGVRGAFAFPIRSGTAITGVVEFFSRVPREPDPDLLEMTAALGSQIGQFIERKRAEEALADRARTAELGAAVGASTTKGTTLREVLQGCAEALVDHLGAAFARIWTLNEAEQMLELQASAGLYTHLDGAHGRVPVGKYKIGLIAAERRPHLTNAVIGDPRVSDQEWAKREGMVSFAGYPLLAQDRLVGVMAMFARHPFNEFVYQALATVADGIAVGIDRKRAEEALARSETTYRSLVDDSPFGIFRSAPDGRLLAVNPALVSILGYDSEAELLQKDLARDVYVDPGERARLIEEVKQQGSLSAESVWRRKDGKTVTVRQTGRVVGDTQGRLEYFNVIIEDITERRLLEAQFRQAQKMEEVGRLAGGIAHDFNNLLTAILGTADLLLDTMERQQERDDVEEIRKAAKRAAELTHQLLAFSRKQVLAPQVLDLNALVRNLDKLLQRLIGEDVALRTVLASELGAVRADPGQLEQVIVNLVVNARDAMPEGGQLTIETANAELDDAYAEAHFPAQPGSYVLLAVSDTGKGMDAATRSHIFEPFFTTKEPGKGTGLGLATVYGVVKQSGGYVWVYSEPGRGSSFKIYLPRVAEAPKPAGPGPQPTGPLGGSETILLVEDDEMVRVLTRRMLEADGYTVLLASHGEEALGLLAGHRGRVDLLVTDVVMPGMSGRDVANRVATLRPGTKVLYLSGYTDDAIVRHGVLEPGIAFLQKPFTADTLARKVREVLEAREP